ncbi:hypothetical protein DOTSEDRAFT_69806 [Dothistroma septosporum NZE10]|uniref:Uncharacterized protein n=1 Tax=Dothistroma septosporum (strain NZE10 / CBS 128990) TaxID=675120 RepID=N1Q0I6_DOTSN|nr:hypothetical protein DOTSEDRAFT_69806 [Dothistroma septosporum NZE10]
MLHHSVLASVSDAVIITITCPVARLADVCNFRSYSPLPHPIVKHRCRWLSQGLKRSITSIDVQGTHYRIL